jgi:hypothetical protein
MSWNDFLAARKAIAADISRGSSAMNDFWKLSVIKPRGKGPLRTTEYLIKSETRGTVASLVTFGDLAEDERNVARLIKSAPTLLHALFEIRQIAAKNSKAQGALADDMQRVGTISFYAIRKATEGIP